MADLKVEVVEIEEVINHGNADRLDIVSVFGYSVVTGRDEYYRGDRAVYFPVDSILPQQLEDHIFVGGKHEPEGMVVRSYQEEKYLGSGRKVLKFIADNYLLKKQSEFK